MAITDGASAMEAAIFIGLQAVNLALFLIVHTGRMDAFCLDSKSARNYTA